MKRIAFLASIALALPACSSPDEEGAEGCGPNDVCAEGFTCEPESQRCVESGAASVILASAVASDSQTVDRVTSADGTIRTDNRNDAAFDITVAGPLTSLSLIVTDAEGKAKSNQIWDTSVGDTAVPGQDIGVTFRRGGQTWQVGVFENDRLLNRADGSLPALEGTRHLRLYAANSGFFTAGVYFRWVLQRPDGMLAFGPVFQYPTQ